MSDKHKIGVHVSAQQRNNYGVAAPNLVSVVTFDPGAFDELDNRAIKIFRTHAIPNHKDAPGDFDRLPDDELEGAAEFWWSILKREYEPIRRRYGDDVYFQPINEINNPRTVLYLRGMVNAAEKDGYKLALWGDAGGSPDLPDWINTWLPFMKEVQAGGHIYSRHAYSGVTVDSVYLTNNDGTPSDSNTGRPFVEAKLMLENGIYMPMVITELGWLAGWNGLPSDWLADILRYNALMMEHENIVGSCLWNAGQWETAPNILSGRPLLELGNQLKTMTPQFYVSGSIQLPSQPDPEATFEDYLEQSAEANRTITYNEVAALEKAITADGLVPFTPEGRLKYSDRDYAYQGARRLGSPEKRVYHAVVGEWGKVGYHIFKIGADGNPFGADPDQLPHPFKGFKMGQPLNVRWAITDKFNAPRAYANGKHEGVDLDDATRTGDSKASVLATNNGRIKSIIRHNGGYGLHVVLQGNHEGHLFTITYGHLDEVYVSEGQYVETGKQLGEIGLTGNVTGEHLHITLQVHGWGLSGYVRDDVIDPLPFLPDPNEAGIKKPSGDRIDMLDYIRGDGRLYELRSYLPNGGQNRERTQTQISGSKFYSVKNSHWREMWYTDRSIYVGTDTSRGGGTFYRMTTAGQYGARWIPRYWSIGKTYTRSAAVQVFNMDGSPVDPTPKPVIDTMSFIARHDKWAGYNGIVLDDVLEIKWAAGESYFYAKGFGLVGWGRTHNDPLTPQGSRIDEIYKLGTRPDNIRETIGG